MDGIRQYVLSVTAAAFICGIVKLLIREKTGYGAIVSLICGVFMAVTVISPWLDLEIADLALYTSEIKSEAQDISESGRNAAEMEFRTIIMEQTETYILDKASSMDTAVQVDVILREDEPVPASAIITGEISPYVKNVLADYMENTLDIPEDAQIWN